MNAPVRRDCHAFRLRTSAQPRWSRRRGRVALPFVKGRLTLHLRLLDALPLISFQLSSRRRSQRHSSQPLISPTIYLAGSSTPCFPTPRPYTLPRFPSIPYTLHSFFFLSTAIVSPRIYVYQSLFVQKLTMRLLSTTFLLFSNRPCLSSITLSFIIFYLYPFPAYPHLLSRPLLLSAQPSPPPPLYPASTSHNPLLSPLRPPSHSLSSRM